MGNVNAPKCSNETDFILGDKEDDFSVVLAVAYLIYLVVGLPLNLLVIVTIVRQRLYTQPTTLLLLNLFITDFLVLLLVLPFSVVTGLAREYIFGNSHSVRCAVCIGHLSLDFVLHFSLLLTITLLTLDRFFFIYKALYYEKLVTVRKMLVAIAMAWILSVLLTVLHYTLSDDTYFASSVFLCVWESGIQNYITIVAEVLPYLLGLLFNVWVIFIAVKNIRAVYKVQETPRGRLRRLWLWRIS